MPAPDWEFHTPMSKTTVALVLAVALAGCAQGPGHTRAAGTIGGTALGAVIGAAASCPGAGAEGALAGALVGMMAGSMAGDAIACDQEAACQPPPQPVVVHPGPVYYVYPAPPPGYVVYPAPVYPAPTYYVPAP